MYENTRENKENKGAASGSALPAPITSSGGALLVLLGWLPDRIGRLPPFQFSLLGPSVLVALITVAPGVLTLTALRGASIAVGGRAAGLVGLLYLTLDALPSGLGVEEIVDRVNKGVATNYG